MNKSAVCAGLVICFSLAGAAAVAGDAGSTGISQTRGDGTIPGYTAGLKPDDTDKPTAQFDEMLQTSQSSSLGLVAEAERAVADSRYDRALQIIKIALHRNYDDLNSHKVYAEALEGKLSEQPQNKKDPLLYEQCVKEWLIVMRSEVGEESGLNVQGAGGVFDSLYKDDDHYVKARYHLKQLTGSAPKPWETDKKYLARVLTKPAHAVSAKLVQKPDEDGKSKDQ